MVDPSRGMFGALIRHVLAALLYELSIVTRPAYPEAQVELREWTPTAASALRRPEPMAHLRRWRP